MKTLKIPAILSAVILAAGLSGCGDDDISNQPSVSSIDAGTSPSPVSQDGGGVIYWDSGDDEEEEDAGESWNNGCNWWEVCDADGGHWWDVDADAGAEDAGSAWEDEEKPLNDESSLDGVRANFDPTIIIPTGSNGGTPAQFLAFPFPSDHRRNEDGTVRFDDFPRPGSLAQTLANNLLDRYLSVNGGVDGFSLNAAVHVSFDGPLNLMFVPTEGDEFLDKDAVFKIIDIDPGSPERGRLRPLRWEWQAEEGNYAAKNSLAIAPSWGFPLREATRYALVIMKTGLTGASGQSLRQPLLLSALLANRSEKPAALENIDDDLYQKLLASYAPLRETLSYKNIDINDVAAATVFTTQDVTKALRAISGHLRRDISSGAWTPKAEYAQTTISYWGGLCSRVNTADTWATCSSKWNSTETAKLYQLAATFDSRNYQQGTVPYLYEGGNFKFKYNGIPNYSNEKLTLMVTIPEVPMTTDSGCVPIVEIAHGTGGDAYSGLGDKTSLRLAARGIATVGMDQPLHGDRFDVEAYMENMPADGILGILLRMASVDAIDADTFLSLVNFNFLNLDAARTCIRQSAVDTMALTHLIKTGGLDVPAEFSPTGKKITFCKDKVGFFGHSQGALSGAVAAGLEHRIGGWLLSAGGGGLGVTILDRKDFGDFPTLLGTLFGLKTGDGETLTEQHILMTAIQTMVDATDPINYAPFWMHDDTFGAPTNQLCTSGVMDSQTPPRSARAMATAARLTPMKPLATAVDEFEWAGVPAADAPLSGNNPGSTNAFIQWANDGDNVNNYNDERWAGHFLVYYRPEAINATMRFLKTFFDPESSDGTPVIERDVTADVKSSEISAKPEGAKVVSRGFRSPSMSVKK